MGRKNNEIMKPKLAFALALIVLLIVFLLQNTHNVKMDFLFWDFNFTLAVLICVSVAIGFILGLLIPRLLRADKEHYKLNNTTPPPPTDTLSV